MDEKINKLQENTLKVYESVEQTLEKNEKLSKITYYPEMQILAKYQEIQWKQDLILIDKEKKLPKKEIVKIQEIYDLNGIKMATIENGTLIFEQTYFIQLQEYCRNNPQLINLLPLPTTKLNWEQILDENKEQKVLSLEGKELNKLKEKMVENQEKEEDTKTQTITEQTISKRKNIPPSQIYMVRENSNLYKDHKVLNDEEKNLFFYRDSDGIVKAEYIDEKTGEAKPSKYIQNSKTEMRKEVSIGKDGEQVEEEVPYQTMHTEGLNTDNSYVRDIRFSINIDMGRLEINEARQGTNGEWSSHEVEIKGRKYNSHQINELTQNKTKSNNPNEISEAYEDVDDTGFREDGIQIDEMTEPQKVIQKFIDEGYQRKEAIDIFNYMIGEEKLTEKLAKERVNEEIKEDKSKMNNEHNKEEENKTDSERPKEDAHSKDYEERLPYWMQE